MPSARHRASAQAPRPLTRVVRLLVTAGLVTATVFTVGGSMTSPATSVDTTVAGASVSAADRSALAESRTKPVSRSGRRVTMWPAAKDHEFATAPLNVWTEPREHGKPLRVVPWGTKLAVTGKRSGHWAQVLFGEQQRLLRWVNADYLAERKPTRTEGDQDGSGSGGAQPSSGGLSTAPCPDGSSVEGGVTPAAVQLYRAVCAAFPQLVSYGGYDAHGEHADGRAIDFMITDSGTGQAVADFVLANASALHVRDIIWSQHIWTPEQASAGWRYMSDRGSPTANHEDHVHVAVF